MIRIVYAIAANFLSSFSLSLFLSLAHFFLWISFQWDRFSPFWLCLCIFLCMTHLTQPSRERLRWNWSRRAKTALSFFATARARCVWHHLGEEYQKNSVIFKFQFLSRCPCCLGDINLFFIVSLQITYYFICLFVVAAWKLCPDAEGKRTDAPLPYSERAQGLRQHVVFRVLHNYVWICVLTAHNYHIRWQW